MDANNGLLCPLAGRGYRVWSPLERKARNGKERHERRLDVRLRPQASGELPQRIHGLASAPSEDPNGRLSGGHGSPSLQGAGGESTQRGADAQLGFPVTANQLAELLFGQCEGSGCAHVGTCTQRWKAGTCARTCTRARRAGKTRRSPDAPKWSTVHAVPGSHMSRPRRDMWPASFPPPRPGESRCGRSMALGGRVYSPPPFMRRTLDIFPLPGAGRLSLSPATSLLCLMAHMGPCVNAALRAPFPPYRSKLGRIPN